MIEETFGAPRLSRGQWVEEERKKTQVFLHHTAGSSASSAIGWWNSQPGRVATAFLIERDGEIVCAFPASHWAFHLGVSGRRHLEMNSVGIELVAWGPLIKEGGRWRPAALGSAEVREDEVVELAWRGQRWWHRYSPAQLSSLRGLLRYLCERHQIPVLYNVDMWDVSQPALAGWPGIWSHSSVRQDKTDCFPQQELIELLKSL